MNRPTMRVVGVLLFFALVATAATPGDDEKPEGDQVSPGNDRGAATANLPLIDVEAPKKTGTATFGLG